MITNEQKAKLFQQASDYRVIWKLFLDEWKAHTILSDKKMADSYLSQLCTLREVFKTLGIHDEFDTYLESK